MNLRRTKPTLDRDTPHVLEVEPPQCPAMNSVGKWEVHSKSWRKPVARCLLPVNHDGQHQWGKG